MTASDSGNYVMLECWEDDELPPHVTLQDVPEFEDVSWISGALIPRERVPQPLRLVVEGEEEDIVPPILDEGIPLWRDDVIAAVRSAGVDNFETFDVELLDARTNTSLGNYKAVNVIGLVAAADLKKSKFTAHGPPLVDVDFDSVAIDQAKARDLAMFRLAECVTAVVIHERVKRALSAIQGLNFVPPKEWIG